MAKATTMKVDRKKERKEKSARSSMLSHSFNNWRGLLSLLFAGLASISLSACGKSAFVVTPNQLNLVTSGTYITPPKVDIIFVVDDTGSMIRSYSTIAQEIPIFLSNLDLLNWDYHFIVVPATTYRKVTQVVGSVYDINRGASWKPRYPGDPGAADPTMLPASVFKLPSTYSDFLSTANMSSALNGSEPTFRNLEDVLTRGLEGSRFSRSDAMKVLVYLGNGNDTSGVNYCPRQPDNVTVPCELIPNTPVCTPTSFDPITGGSMTCASSTISFDYYKNRFQTLFPGIKMYSIVATQQNSNCLGSFAYAGTRYMNLATFLGGKSFDLCTNASIIPPPISLPGVNGTTTLAPQSVGSGVVGLALSDMTSYLQTQKRTVQHEYLMIEKAQTPSQVYRLIGGDPNKRSEIPKDAPSSTSATYWTYEGMLQNVFTLSLVSPDGSTVIKLSLESGNAIRFRGTLPTGDDRFVVVTYPTGTQNSVSN